VRGRFSAGAETAVAGLLWFALVLGLSVLTLTVPVFTSAAVQALGVPASAGLSVDDTVLLSAGVRALVADQEYDPLPRTWLGALAFDESAVSHLLDVRNVLIAARVATGAAAALLAAYVAWCVARRRWRALAGGMRAGALGVLGLVVLAALAAFLDFSTFFAAFHSLFFAAGTWQFPYDSLLIRLFPERFWTTAGAAWAVLAACGAGLLLLTARYVPSVPPSGASPASPVALREEEDSRTAQDV
jgi:integral membrane protein (TIGR01906 family)